jgi:hypothetical protein
MKSGAGEPSGVVDSTSVRDNGQNLGLGGTRLERKDLLCGAFSLSRNEPSMAEGKVPPRSQMSMSFLIFSYMHERACEQMDQ